MAAAFNDNNLPQRPTMTPANFSWIIPFFKTERTGEGGEGGGGRVATSFPAWKIETSFVVAVDERPRGKFPPRFPWPWTVLIPFTLFTLYTYLHYCSISRPSRACRAEFFKNWRCAFRDCIWIILKDLWDIRRFA